MLHSLVIGAAGSVAVAVFIHRRSTSAAAPPAAKPAALPAGAKSLRVRGGMIAEDYQKLPELDLGNMPGANMKAYLMLPVRVTVFLFFFSLRFCR